MVLDLFKENAWLQGLHQHIGSQGIKLEQLVLGAQRLVGLAGKINNQVMFFIFFLLLFFVRYFLTLIFVIFFHFCPAILFLIFSVYNVFLHHFF